MPESAPSRLGFNEIGRANGIPIYTSAEKANALRSAKRTAENGLAPPSYRFLLPAMSSDSSLRGKFNDDGRSDYCFWIRETGKDTNQLVTDSQEAEITPLQEAEALRLAESGMKYQDIAKKLGIPAVGVYYALKKGKEAAKKRSRKPRTTALCTFDKKGNLLPGKGSSLENTVRVSKGSDDEALLFFVLRDSYSRVGGARFVIAACNGRQFTPEFEARVIVGVPREEPSEP